MVYAWKLEGGVSDEVDELSRGILESAEKEREDDDRQHNRWTWITFALYVLGSVISVAGVLMGAEGAEELEELAA